MEILGVGVPELFFIVLIALILLGPKDMAAAGRTIASTYRKILMSPVWQVMRLTRDEFQQASTKLVREAGFVDEVQSMQKEVENVTRDVTRQIQPADFKIGFDERQIFGPPASIPDPKPVSPPNQPEASSGPPAAPET